MVNPLHTHRPHAIEYVLRKVDLHHIHMKSGTANRSAHAVLFVVIRPVCVCLCVRVVDWHAVICLARTNMHRFGKVEQNTSEGSSSSSSSSNLIGRLRAIL